MKEDMKVKVASEGADDSIKQPKGTISRQILTEDSDSELGKDAGCMSCCAPEKRLHILALKLIACILAGIVFGWSLEKGRGKLTFELE